MHLACALLIVLQWVSTSVSCAEVGTQTLVLDSEASLPQQPPTGYTAINVTIRPWQRSSILVFPFRPLSRWTNLTEVCSPRGPLPSGYAPSGCPYNASCANFSAVARISTPLKVLDFWTDRSVIVLNRIAVNLTDREPCVRVMICGMSRCEPTQNTDSSCYQAFGLVSTHCKARNNRGPPFTSIHPVSEALKVVVYTNSAGLPDHPHSGLSFVASTGYRLMPGVFRCPKNTFLCKPFNRCSDHDSSFCYEHRICLPDSLRCDNHLNCPDSASDEENCGESILGAAAAPVSMDADDLLQQKTEIAQMTQVLNSLNTSQLALAGYQQLSDQVLLAIPGSTVLLLSLGFLALFMVALCSVCCVVRRRHYKRYPPGRRRFGADRFAADVQPVWPERVATSRATASPVELTTYDARPKWLPTAYARDVASEPATTDAVRQ